MSKLKAFTLSELLVSLAVLGLIAAVSIPKVYNSVKEQREKAVWKETISTLSTLYMEGAMNGNSGLDLKNFVLTHVNTKRLCDVAVNTQGCYEFHEMNERGFELTNGAVINGIGPGSSPQDRIAIDINGSDLPNTYGEDRIYLHTCLREDCSNTTRTIVGLIEARSDHPASVSLYNEIFGAG